MKMTILKSTVFHTTDISSVALTQTQLDTCLVSKASFDQYLALLCSTATQYDKVCQTTPHATLKHAIFVCHNQFGVKLDCI